MWVISLAVAFHISRCFYPSCSDYSL